MSSFQSLVVDVGNTETVVGLAFGTREIGVSWRVSSSVKRTPDEMIALVGAFLSGHDHGPIGRGVVGSVVPSVNQVWVRTLSAFVTGEVLTVGPASRLPIELAVDEPLSVGADRVANTLAAKVLYGRDTIAVDLGTATTFDCIKADGTFLGGVIAPGLNAGLEWLAERTAKLPVTELSRPTKVIGTRTEECIRSGVFHAAVSSIDGVVRLVKEEWGRRNALVVATGGLAGVVAPYLSEVELLEPDLTMLGLALAGECLATSPPD